MDQMEMDRWNQQSQPKVQEQSSPLTAQAGTVGAKVPHSSPGSLSLAGKLAEACANVGGVEKRGRNEAQRYDYVKAADVAKSIRKELFNRGVVVIPDEIECTTKQISFQNAKGETRNSNEVIVKTAYIITDGKETLTFHGYGIAWDAGDKAVYKAKTGALKYFLRGLGLIPDEKDDPEADESIDRATKGLEFDPVEFDQRTEDQQNIALFQLKAIDEACRRTGKTEDEIKAYLGLMGETRLEHIKKSDFQKFLQWANSAKKREIGDFVTDTKLAFDRGAAKPVVRKQSTAEITAMRKLFAMANEYRIPENDVKQAAYEKFKVKSMTELSVPQLEDMGLWIKSVADAIEQS